MVQVYTLNIASQKYCKDELLNHVAGNMLRKTTFSTEEQADKTNVPLDQKLQSIDGIIPSI